MSTPYEEISENYSSRAAVKTDANLAQDTLQLGGLDAEDYATKEYVKNYANKKYTDSTNYTDNAIEDLEEELKGYTDKSIDNIDLSIFAKLTDLTTVKNQLTESCEDSCSDTLTSAKEYTDTVATTLKNNCADNCSNNLATAKEYTDTVATTLKNNCANSCSDNLASAKKYADSLVETTNSNVTALTEKYDELFQSVSDGKQKVAEAITDKGVSTSATDTFETMATNISNISTESTGIDTSDATASASTILRNYTAYVDGEKVTGSYVPAVIPDTTTYGTDTSDATATTSDILSGKTAYVDGQKITGTLVQTIATVTDTDGTTTTASIIPVTEIYKLSDTGYEQELVTGYTSDWDDDNETTITVLTKAVTMGNGNTAYTVRDIKESSGNKYIYSNKITSTSTGQPAIVIQESAGDTETITKKFRYSYDELGLTGTVKKIYFGAAGYEGHSKVCLLYILEKASDDTLQMHIYPYHLSDEGIIGNAYTNEFAYPHRTMEIKSGIITSYSNWYHIDFAKNSPYNFVYTYIENSTTYIRMCYAPPYSKFTYTIDTLINSGSMYYSPQFQVEDTLLVCNKCPDGSTPSVIYFIENNEELDTEYEIGYAQEFTVGIGAGITGLQVYFSDDGKYAYTIKTYAQYSGTDYGLVSATIDYENHKITFTKIKSFILNYVNNTIGDNSRQADTSLFFTSQMRIWFSKDNQYIFMWYHDVYWRFYIFKVTIDGDNTAITGYIKSTDTSGMNCPVYNTDCSLIYAPLSKAIYAFSTSTSTEIIAITYKGQKFYSVKASSEEE